MIFESVISTIATLVAAGYAAHKIENVFLARRGYDTRNFFKPDPLPTPEPTLAVALWTEEDERRQALAFIEHPLAFWLDPNLFGDNPNWRDKLLPRDEYGDTPLPVIYGRTRVEGVRSYPGDTDNRTGDAPRLAPPCPTCPDGGKRTVMNIHGGEATMWDCFECGTEFTRAGETKTSRKKRREREFHVLPCGCTGTITRLSPGGYVSRCDTCEAEWEPRSNDSTGRSLGQGEKVKTVADRRARRKLVDQQRPRCPKCDRSHPELHEPLDGSPMFYKCGGCKKQWKAVAKHDDYDMNLPLPPSME